MRKQAAKYTISGALAGALLGNAYGRYKVGRKSTLVKALRRKLGLSDDDKLLIRKSTFMGGSMGALAGSTADAVAAVKRMKSSYSGRAGGGYSANPGGGYYGRSASTNLGGGYNGLTDALRRLGLKKKDVKNKRDVKKAYRGKARQHHPDQHADKPTDVRKQHEDEMKSINRAFSRVAKDPFFDRLPSRG